MTTTKKLFLNGRTFTVSKQAVISRHRSFTYRVLYAVVTDGRTMNTDDDLFELLRILRAETIRKLTSFQRTVFFFGLFSC